MVFDAPRKLALFSSLLLLVTAALALVPDVWMLGNPARHRCHDATAPADHLRYRPSYPGYNSLCSFSPLSTLMPAGTAIIIFVTTFRIRFHEVHFVLASLGVSQPD
jgi:hypothetical protein